jgi:hypothetical protein
VWRSRSRLLVRVGMEGRLASVGTMMGAAWNESVLGAVVAKGVVGREVGDVRE